MARPDAERSYLMSPERGWGAEIKPETFRFDSDSTVGVSLLPTSQSWDAIAYLGYSA
jgi:hypothetical protein